MSFKVISYLELWQLLCSAEQIHILVQFWYWELCGTLLSNHFQFRPVIKEMLFKDISYLELWWLLYPAKWNHLRNFARNHREEQLCGFILFVCFCCFTSQVNSFGHGWTVSSPNHTFPWASLNKQLTSTSCTYFLF